MVEIECAKVLENAGRAGVTLNTGFGVREACAVAPCLEPSRWW